MDRILIALEKIGVPPVVTGALLLALCLIPFVRWVAASHRAAKFGYFARAALLSRHALFPIGVGIVVTATVSWLIVLPTLVTPLTTKLENATAKNTELQQRNTELQQASSELQQKNGELQQRLETAQKQHQEDIANHSRLSEFVFRSGIFGGGGGGGGPCGGGGGGAGGPGGPGGDGGVGCIHPPANIFDAAHK